MRCLWTQTARQLPGGSLPPYARATALWRNSSKSLRFMDPPLDLAMLALLITLSRQYTCSSVVDGVELATQHADHNYPDTELRMSRIKTRTGSLYLALL